MSHELRLTLPADAAGARDAAVRVRALFTAADGADALACELAVAEAAANVVLLHGFYALRPARQCI